MTDHKTAEEFFNDYLKRRNIRRSRPREMILEILLLSPKHLSAAEIFALARKKYPRIGYATVYRAMRLICESGIAEKIELGRGAVNFECKFGAGHHDHLVCVQCGRYIEVLDKNIEELQLDLARRHGFILQRHEMHLFGVCAKCQKKRKPRNEKN